MKNSLTSLTFLVLMSLTVSAYSASYKCQDETGTVTFTDIKMPSLSVVENCATNNRSTSKNDRYLCTLSSSADSVWTSSQDVSGKALACNQITDDSTNESKTNESVTIRLISEDPLENSAIWADCKKSDAQMDCQFTQVLIDNEPSQQEVDRKIKTKQGEFLGKKDLSQRHQFCEVVSYASSESFANKLAEKKGDPLAKNIEQEMRAIAKAGTPYCSSPTKENTLLLSKYLVQSEIDACHVNVRIYSEKFTLQNDSVWTHNAGPKGLCGMVEVTTLIETSPYAWVYRVNRVITNRKGDKLAGKNSACDKFEEGARTYSWKGTPKFRNCKQLNFDFLL